MKYILLTGLAHTKTLSDGTQLSRIIALQDFSDVKKGEVGGWLASEANLTQAGNSWVYDEAMVYGNALVRDNAQVFDEAIVRENAIIADSAKVCGHAQVYGSAAISGNVSVSNYIKVYGDASLSGNFAVKGDYGLFSDTVATKAPRVLATEDLTMVLADNNVLVGCSCYSISRWESFSTAQIELITPGSGWLFSRYEALFKAVMYLPYLTPADIEALQNIATAAISPGEGSSIAP